MLATLRNILSLGSRFFDPFLKAPNGMAETGIAVYSVPCCKGIDLIVADQEAFGFTMDDLSDASKMTIHGGGLKSVIEPTDSLPLQKFPSLQCVPVGRSLLEQF